MSGKFSNGRNGVEVQGNETGGVGNVLVWFTCGRLSVEVCVYPLDRVNSE